MSTIDGSTLEGGGQLTRMTLCLSAITRIPIRIHSIRAGRSSPNKTARDDHNQHRDRSQRKRGGRSRAVPHETGRTTAGLKDSHLAALDFLAEQCGARVEGASVGSSDIVFRPSTRGTRVTTKNVNPGSELESEVKRYTITLKKPGSVWLIFQAIYPYLVFSTDWSQHSSTTRHASNRDQETPAIILTLKGGTNVPKAMTTEYMQQVFTPMACRIGLPRLEIDTVKRGWAGNAPEIGEVTVRIFPPSSSSFARFVLPGFTIRSRDPTISKIDITVIADPESTRATLVNGLTTCLTQRFPDASIEVVVCEPSLDPRRLYVLLVAHTGDGYVIGRDFVGGGARPKSVTEEKRKIDEICSGLVAGLASEVVSGSCIDGHLVDQLVVFQALASGVSTVRAGDGGHGNEDEDGNQVDPVKIVGVGDQSGTLHARTVRWVCESMLQSFGVRFGSGGVCYGIGWNSDECKENEDGLTMAGLDIADDDDDDPE